VNKEELININGIREDLYQAMQIGDITLSSKNSQELYDFMNYQDKEIDRLNNIINELEKNLEEERKKDRPRDDYNYGVGNTLDYIWYKLQKLKGETENE